MGTNCYKIVDEETGYSKYICDDGKKTSIVYLGSNNPKVEEINGKYKKQPDEVVQSCSQEEYFQKHYECLAAIENVYENEPSLI